MIWFSGGRLARLALVPILFSIGIGTAACSFNFCAGSGCNDGKIFFGSNFKQTKAGGDISVVAKTSTFQLGENVAMVADLSEKANTHTLTLQVKGKIGTHTMKYPVRNSSSNVLANLFGTAQLKSLGVSSRGTYTWRILRGTKQLAKGSFTEK